MRWFKAGPGVYTSGAYKIEGSGNSWTLDKLGELLATCASKGSCQDRAEVFNEDEINAAIANKQTEKSEPSNQTEDDEPPQIIKTNQDDSPRTRIKANRVDGLENVLASMRLDLSRLSEVNAMLVNAINELTIAVRKLDKR